MVGFVVGSVAVLFSIYKFLRHEYLMSFSTLAVVLLSVLIVLAMERRALRNIK